MIEQALLDHPILCQSSAGRDAVVRFRQAVLSATSFQELATLESGGSLAEAEAAFWSEHLRPGESCPRAGERWDHKRLQGEEGQIADLFTWVPYAPATLFDVAVASMIEWAKTVAATLDLTLEVAAGISYRGVYAHCERRISAIDMSDRPRAAAHFAELGDNALERLREVLQLPHLVSRQAELDAAVTRGEVVGSRPSTGGGEIRANRHQAIFYSTQDGEYSRVPQGSLVTFPSSQLAKKFGYRRRDPFFNMYRHMHLVILVPVLLVILVIATAAGVGHMKIGWIAASVVVVFLWLMNSIVSETGELRPWLETLEEPARSIYGDYVAYIEAMRLAPLHAMLYPRPEPSTPNNNGDSGNSSTSGSGPEPYKTPTYIT